MGGRRWELIKRTIDDCDYYIVIIAHRYGTTDGGISYTEKEYDYANSKRIPTLGFVIDDSAKWPKIKMDSESSAVSPLTAFKAKIKGKIVSFWQSKDDLHGKLTVALSKAITAYPRLGWVKADDAIGAGTAGELARLSKENSELRGVIAEYEKSAATSKTENESKIIKMLEGNKASVSFYYEKEEDWSKHYPFSYLKIFSILAPELIVEKSITDTSKYLGVMLNPDKTKPPKTLRRSWPTPSNTVKNILADFHALGIAAPSPKKHSVHDKEQYWCITELGVAIYARIRLTTLEKGEAKPQASAVAYLASLLEGDKKS